MYLREPNPHNCAVTSASHKRSLTEKKERVTDAKFQKLARQYFKASWAHFQNEDFSKSQST